MRRLTALAWTAAAVTAAAVPSIAQASPQYQFCSPASRGTTYLLARSNTSCRHARALERAALGRPVLSYGPYQSAAWWPALGQRWQTSARGKQTSGAYRGTWEYGIWSERAGVNTCPAVYFFLKHRLTTVGN